MDAYDDMILSLQIREFGFAVATIWILGELLVMIMNRTLTLIYAARDTKHNNAVLLAKYLLDHADHGASGALSKEPPKP